MIEIREIKASETYNIRKTVLRDGIPLSPIFEGDLVVDTFHLGAFKDNALIAVSTYINASTPYLEGSQYQLRGMATLQDYQGLGAGKLMLQYAVLKLIKKSIDYLWCNARINAVSFYKKQGLKTIGDEFSIPYIGKHYVMFKEINKTPH